MIIFSVLLVTFIFLFCHPVKNPFENLSDPSSFGLPDSTVHFYISGPAGKLGAWLVFCFCLCFVFCFICYCFTLLQVSVMQSIDIYSLKIKLLFLFNIAVFVITLTIVKPVLSAKLNV